jgi:hypothetical protein
MAEKMTAVKNAMPHQNEHCTRKNAIAADLDHFIPPYHTHVNRTVPKLTSIGTRAFTEINGQNEPSDTSEQGIKNRRHHNYRK